MRSDQARELRHEDRRCEFATFQQFVISLTGNADPSLPIAAARAGATGIVDLTHCFDAEEAERVVRRLATLARGQFGFLLRGGLCDVARAALDSIDGCDTILLLPDNVQQLTGMIDQCRSVARRIGLIAVNQPEAELADKYQLDFVVAKGNEAGGRIGEETTFVLLQRLLGWGRLPVIAWGGIGTSTAVACHLAGASGVMLDWQLALTRESPLADVMKRRLAQMDGSETLAIAGPAGQQLRVYQQPWTTAPEKLQSAANDLCDLDEADARREWQRAINELLAEKNSADRLWLIGQDAVFASRFSAEAATVSRALADLRKHVGEQLDRCRESAVLTPGGPLAASHGTEFPIVQGPMTRVSDVPQFAKAIADGGGLPFMALAMMRGDAARKMLEETRDLLDSKPWGVGVLGFAQRDLRADQFSIIEDVRPPFAIIAGGRPDQAAGFEKKGIKTYLHVPSPGMLSMFLAEGARRFVFEGASAVDTLGRAAVSFFGKA